MTSKVPTEIYSRVSGYYRPVAQWNGAKQEEFSQRAKLKFGGEYVKDKTSIIHCTAGSSGNSLHANPVRV